jgi:sulfite exporter TauE/SafE
MTPDLYLLVATAASIGFVHTLLGPDHYLPFVALARARGWSQRKTIAVTTICGLGHVGSSVLLGSIGIAAGLAVERLMHIESVRGDIAAWLLLAFGLVYLMWGIRRGIAGHAHRHAHVHADGTRHDHTHDHKLAPHVHPHLAPAPVAAEWSFTPVKPVRSAPATPWVLFIIFIFGPCEPLIPVLMYPAAHASGMTVAVVCAAFALATIGTMLSVVLLALKGLEAMPVQHLERWSHALAGGALVACAGGILWLGL